MKIELQCDTYYRYNLDIYINYFQLFNGLPIKNKARTYKKVAFYEDENINEHDPFTAIDWLWWGITWIYWSS